MGTTRNACNYLITVKIQMIYYFYAGVYVEIAKEGLNFVPAAGNSLSDGGKVTDVLTWGVVGHLYTVQVL